MARGGGKMKRGGSRPKYPIRLLKEIGESADLNNRRRRGRTRKSAQKEEPEQVAKDLYEYEEGIPQEESKKNRRFDNVDNLEYELPSDFEDEEIDEDAAFGDEENLHDEEDMQGDTDMGGEYDGLLEDEDGEEEDGGVSDEEEELLDDGEDIDEEAHERMLEELTRSSRKRARENDDQESDLPEADEVHGPLFNTALLTRLEQQPGINALKKKTRISQKHSAPALQPAPKALQDKLDRKAAYKKTSKDITKWQPLIKQNREAATLNFIKKANLSFQTTGEMVANFVPTTELEKEVAAVLKEHGVDDPYKIAAAEELELNKLTIEEAKKRRDKLAQMRSLLFRHEVKAKRLKKIKSKAFRRGERLAQKKSKPDMLIDDPEMLKEEAIKQETERAKERMTLKHKNTSRWAKRIIQRGGQQLDEGTREALNEQLRKHAQLTQKINAANPQSSSDEESDSEDEAEPEGLVLDSQKQGGKAMAKAKLELLKALEEGDNEAEAPKTSLFALPFMTRAIERKRREAESDAKALLQELEDAEENGEAPNASAPLATGRRTFGGAQNHSAVKDDEDDREVYERDSDSEFSDDERPQPSKPKAKVKQGGHAPPKEDSELAEIQLDGLRMQAPVDDTVRTDGPVSVEETGGKKKKKKNRKRKRAAEGAQTHSVIAANPTIFGAGGSINTGADASTANGTVTIAGQPSKKAKKQDEEAHQVEQSDSGQEESEDDDVPIGSRTQEDLIREAFAGDDVEAEFEELKAKAAEEEGPKDQTEDLTLPGWGQWTAVQNKHGPPKWLVKQQEEQKKKKEDAKRRRQDAKLKCFIVSEKSDKKAAKFYAASVPFPFTSKEAYENSIRMPIGPEYNTFQSFKDFTRPEVIKRTGVIINPIDYEKPKVESKKNKKNKARK